MEEHKVKKPTSPCSSDCPRRSATCAASCGRLKVYKEQQRRYYAQRAQEIKASNDSFEYRLSVIKRSAHGNKPTGKIKFGGQT